MLQIVSAEIYSASRAGAALAVIHKSAFLLRRSRLRVQHSPWAHHCAKLHILL